jgi:thiol:disulfide interchange protein DsbD
LGPLRLLYSLGSFAFAIYLFTGLFGAPLGEFDAFFPPYGSQGAISKIRSGEEELTWRTDYAAALSEARTAQKPIFIDFTGYACTNCRWMEANVFPDPEVRALLDRYVRVQLYTDGLGEAHKRNRAFQETRFGTVALPFYAIMSNRDGEIVRFPGLTRDKGLFIRFLKKGIADAPQADVSGGEREEI